MHLRRLRDKCVIVSGAGAEGRNNSGLLAFVYSRDDPEQQGRMRGSELREQFEAEPEEVFR